jgi:hypothetical protein
MTDELKNSEELKTVADITFIEPDKARFYVLDEDFLGLEYDGEDKKRISLHRALPVSSPGTFICILDAEGKEIGIIRSLEGFGAEQTGLVNREIAMRYFTPTVERITSSKEKMGYVYFDLVTSAGKKSIAIKDVTKSIRQLDEKRLLILDVDGNRFMIPNLPELDRGSMKHIESYLF